MILCVGPSLAGKTLLLRKLQQNDVHVDALTENFDTIPTVGTNIVNVRLKTKNKISIVELGGSMAPIWHNHYQNSSGVIFVIDSCNLQQVSCAGILLLEVVTHELLQKSKILVLLNKTDISTSLTIDEVKYILRIDDICKHAKQDISVIETSCFTGRGIAEIKNWLCQFSSKK